MDGNPPARWDVRECLWRMTRNCIAKVRTLERNGELSDVDSAHIRDALVEVLREIGNARWLLAPAGPAATPEEFARELFPPLPTEPVRASERIIDWEAQ
jgi:hypothetical protein